MPNESKYTKSEILNLINLSSKKNWKFTTRSGRSLDLTLDIPDSYQYKFLDRISTRGFIATIIGIGINPSMPEQGYHLWYLIDGESGLSHDYPTYVGIKKIETNADTQEVPQFIVDSVDIKAILDDKKQKELNREKFISHVKQLIHSGNYQAAVSTAMQDENAKSEDLEIFAEIMENRLDTITGELPNTITNGDEFYQALLEIYCNLVPAKTPDYHRRISAAINSVGDLITELKEQKLLTDNSDNLKEIEDRIKENKFKLIMLHMKSRICMGLDEYMFQGELELFMSVLDIYPHEMEDIFQTRDFNEFIATIAMQFATFKEVVREKGSYKKQLEQLAQYAKNMGDGPDCLRKELVAQQADILKLNDSATKAAKIIEVQTNYIADIVATNQQQQATITTQKGKNEDDALLIQELQKTIATQEGKIKDDALLIQKLQKTIDEQNELIKSLNSNVISKAEKLMQEIEDDINAGGWKLGGFNSQKTMPDTGGKIIAAIKDFQLKNNPSIVDITDSLKRIHKYCEDGAQRNRVISFLKGQDESSRKRYNSYKQWIDTFINENFGKEIKNTDEVNSSKLIVT